MADMKRLLFDLLRSRMTGSRPHRVRRGFGGSALGGAGMSLLGSLATAAVQRYMQQRDASSSKALAGAPHETPAAASDETAHLLIQAMIAAAKADGGIDYGERQRILAELTDDGAGDEERAFIQSEMEKPLNLDALVSRVSGPHMAEEVYAASLLAIEVDTPAEQKYLQDLAARLHLDAATVAQLHDRFDAPQPKGAVRNP